MTDQACETPLSDHIANALERMEAGARMILDAIPNDSSLSSAAFSSDVTKEVARLVRIGAAVQPASQPMLSGGDGMVRGWALVPTETMIEEGMRYIGGGSTFDSDERRDIAIDVFMAMIAAAPASNGEAVDEARSLIRKGIDGSEAIKTQVGNEYELAIYFNDLASLNAFEKGLGIIIDEARAALSAINKTGGE